MKKLIEKQNDLMKRAEEVLNKVRVEERELTEAEAQELAEIRDDIRKIKETLKLDDDFRELEPKEEKKDNEPIEEEQPMEEKERQCEVEKREERAFEAFIRGNAMNIREGEPTPVNLTKGDNGAIIPTTVVNRIIRKVYDICPILERSQKFNVKGNLQIPFYPADANVINVAYAEEFSPLVSSAGKTGSVVLTGYLAGALTKVSRSLINNAQLDVVGFVIDEMAYAIKRFIEHELLIGTPADAGAGTDAKVLGLSTLSNGIVSASASAITADEVVKLHDKIKDEFQANAMWIMHPETRTALRLLKSATGYYLLNDDMSSPFGVSLLGKPVYVSDNMPKISDGGAVIYYGDFKGLATKFNEEISIQVLRERFADEHCDGVVGWFEFDSKVIDEQQIAKLTMAE